MLKLGVVGSSKKENEKRVPIYPAHLDWIDARIRRQLVFEEGYGARFGLGDDHFRSGTGGVAPRERLLSDCDLLVLPKPTVPDLRAAREGQALWGWAHCVQQHAITQAAIDRRLTVIAWESMNHWNEVGQKLMHIFYKNNEIAGYAAVLHALELLGMDGHYGPRRTVVVLGFGSVSKGAIYALQGRGFNNIHVFTKRPVHLVIDQNPDVYYGHFYADADGDMCAKSLDGRVRPLVEVLGEADLVVNGILQDTDHPTHFIEPDEVGSLKPGSLIVDVSCDEGMGFPFARPTTFSDPVFTVGPGVTYYSVDHTPSYLWNAASREISKALLPFLEAMVSGPAAWASDPTIQRAIEIEQGHVVNGRILSFQKRRAEYPHDVIR